MDFVVLGAFVIGVSVILPIYLFFSQQGLKRRISELESRLSGEAPVAPPVPVPDIGTETPQEPPKRPEPERSGPPKAFVFREGFGKKITGWLQKNWFYAVAAVSFALAGVFLVQYGVENGLLTPAMRVVGAMVLGAALIGGGEYIRRKSAGDEAGSFKFLPSVLSGAGLVSLFAGVLAARLMYGLVGPQAAFAGLVATGLLAIVLGWFYGPLLAIVGVFGALATPFLVGGDSDTAYVLQLYFAGIAAVALAIDSVKRWAWLSSLGLIGAYVAAVLLFAATQDAPFLVLFALLTTAAAVMLPVRQLLPRHGGPMLSQVSTVQVEGQAGMTLPEFPTRVAGGAFIASTLLVGLAYVGANGDLWLSLGALALMGLAAVVWMRKAPALGDLVFVVLPGILVLLAIEAMGDGPVFAGWMAARMRDQLDFPPATVLVLLGGAIGASLLLAWRSWQGGAYPRFTAGVAAGFAPLFAAVLDLLWDPAPVLGAPVWALYLAAVAGVMTVLAERFARKDREDRTRPALFALSAMTMLAFMSIVLFGDVTLTLSLAVLVAAAAWLGRRFELPLMDRYVQAGVLAMSWRLVIVPGALWAFEGELWRVVLANTGSIALLVAAYVLRRKGARVGVVVMLESAVWSLSAVFLSVMYLRWFDYTGSSTAYQSAAVVGTIWLVSAANQLYRLKAGAELRRTRAVLAALYGLAGFAALGMAVTVLNPLSGFAGGVGGPYVFDTLFASYAVPALLVGLVALRFVHLPRRLRQVLGFVAAGLGALYIGLEIRRWWQGDDLSVYGVRDGELYSYTVAMLIVAVLLLVLAVLRRSALLRKLMLVMVGLTVAKVYLVDMSGLDGLLRVVSFLGIGVVVGGMAWVNRLLQRGESGKVSTE